MLLALCGMIDYDSMIPKDHTDWILNSAFLLLYGYLAGRYRGRSWKRFPDMWMRMVSSQLEGTRPYGDTWDYGR